MKKLAKLVKELERDLLICVRCGTCHGVCPLYNITRDEGDVARGKLSLLDGLIKNLFSKSDEVNKILNKCLLCGSCAASCPSNVKVTEIFIKARIILAQFSKLSIFKKIAFRFFIANPKRFDMTARIMEKFQFLFLTTRKNINNTSSLRLISPFINSRKFKKIAKIPFHKTKDAKGFSSKKSKFKVAFFPGCVFDKFYPEIAIDTVKILKHFNVDIFIPQNQGCCGIPSLASGDKETFTKLVGHNIGLFLKEDFDCLVTPCATCLSTIKEWWPIIYKSNDEKQNFFLNNLSIKSHDISQFLINILKVPDISNNNAKTITYHDPCHHKKNLKIEAEPRKLIIASGNNLVEMEKSDSCCGMGGTFNLLYYDESIKIGKLKVENIKKTNCSIVATSCPACMAQLTDIAAKQNLDIKINHPIEIYKKTLFNSIE